MVFMAKGDELVAVEMGEIVVAKDVVEAKKDRDMMGWNDSCPIILKYNWANMERRWLEKIECRWHVLPPKKVLDG